MLCRRRINTLILLCAAITLCMSSCKNSSHPETRIQMERNKNTTDEQWAKVLSPDEYYILREKGTERPFSGQYNSNYEAGTYNCAGCDQTIFASDSKFDSHCGWPSFDTAIEGTVVLTEDRSHNMLRVEVTCANCGGHLGHVFPDGPKETTGERFCINSVSLTFKPAK